jgi:hypothetical protein
MMKSDHLSLLLDSENYRAFLQSYVRIKNIKMSDFARLVGCNRGFPADVVNGRRRLTAKSYSAFEQAFKLPLVYKNFFQLLVAKEESDIFLDINRSTIDIKIQNIKQQKQTNSSKKHETQKVSAEDHFQKVLEHPFSFLVFAAVGAPETGALKPEIQRRTRLTDSQLDKTLNLLNEADLIQIENDRYFPKDLHIFFQLKNTDIILSRLFNQGVRFAEKRLAQITPNSSEMFFVSQFCIHENQMPHFKKVT